MPPRLPRDDLLLVPRLPLDERLLPDERVALPLEREGDDDTRLDGALRLGGSALRVGAVRVPGIAERVDGAGLLRSIRSREVDGITPDERVRADEVRERVAALDRVDGRRVTGVDERPTDDRVVGVEREPIEREVDRVVVPERVAAPDRVEVTPREVDPNVLLLVERAVPVATVDRVERAERVTSVDLVAVELPERTTDREPSVD